MTTEEIKALALIYDLSRSGLIGEGILLQANHKKSIYMKAHEILETFDWPRDRILEDEVENNPS